MRQGTRWIVAPAAGLMLLIGGVGVASGMNEGDRSSTVSAGATTAVDIGTVRGRDQRAADDRGARPARDERAGDDHGVGPGRDDPAGDDRGARPAQDGANLTGTAAQQARAAALAAVPGASVREIEHRTDTAGAVYHVELIQRDGTKVEVDLDASFHPVKIERSGDDN
jgi:uncharacterized membrane protein YkoI